MDQKLPVIAKKLWNIVRVAYFMLKKGLSSKRKLMFDLSLLMKRGKIAGKAVFQNLMFQVHNHINDVHVHQSTSKEYYEFSCSNSPAFHLPFHINKRNINKHSQPEHAIEHDDVSMMNAAVLKALEMIQSETASPALPGFGRTPTVRQLRITDSPFALTSDADNDDIISTHVDEKADEFISRFYRDLRREAASAFA